MAIFHCQAKAISRAAGRSATAAAAYRAGVCLKDERTGEVHDYSRKKGVEYSEIITPDNSMITRDQLWNAAEAAEKRKDAKVAREWEIALPDELDEAQQIELAQTFARELVARYGVAADLCLHAPSKEGDDRNRHVHILTTTRVYEAGQLGAKTRVLDSPKTSGKEVEAVRQLWAIMANRALERAGHEARIDSRSLSAQGIDRKPTRHVGPTATAMERRGIKTERGNLNRAATPDEIELTALEYQQHQVSLARQDARRMWKQILADTAEAKRRQKEAEKRRLEIEKRQKEEARQREEARQNAANIFNNYLSFQNFSQDEKKERLVEMLEEWERYSTKEQTEILQQLQKKIKEIEQMRQREQRPRMRM